MKTTIICFSPTGGVEKVAQLIANELKVAAPYDYTTRGYEVSFSSDDLVFFCFPVYGGRIPTPMYDRMNYVHGNGAKAVLVAVYGNRAVEDALLEMSDLCLNRGFKVVGGAEMIAPHSIDKRWRLPSLTHPISPRSISSSPPSWQSRSSPPLPCPASARTRSIRASLCTRPQAPSARLRHLRAGVPDRGYRSGRSPAHRQVQVHQLHALREYVPVLPAPRPQGDAACRLRRAHQNVRRAQGTQVLSVISDTEQPRLYGRGCWFSISFRVLSLSRPCLRRGIYRVKATAGSGHAPACMRPPVLCSHRRRA